jgi:DNA-directed RNA polymerase subunit L
MSKFDINVDKIQFIKNKFSETKLILNIYGDDINNFVLNSLKKVCIDQVPVYAFSEDGIKVITDTSVFDPTELKMELCSLPIFNIKYDIKYIPYKYYEDTSELPENITKIEYYIKLKNNNFETIRDVTTNDISISINDEHIENSVIYDPKVPISLFKLRYNDEVELSMKAKLGVGEMNGIFNASHSWFYDLDVENDEEAIEFKKIIKKNNKNNKIKKDAQNNYIFIIESSGQLNELEILKRGIEQIIIKTENIKKDINENLQTNPESSNKIVLDLENEDFTCIGQINYFLQSDKDAINSGANKPNLLEKRIHLGFSVVEGKSFLDVLNRNIDKSVEFYKELLKKVRQIN